MYPIRLPSLIIKVYVIDYKYLRAVSYHLLTPTQPVSNETKSS